MNDPTDLMAEANNVVRIDRHGPRLARAQAKPTTEAQIFSLRVRRRIMIDWMTGQASLGEILRSIERKPNRP